MSTAVSKFRPSGIDFGEIAPSSKRTDTVVIDPVPADVLVTATIAEGGPVFKVNRIIAFDRVLAEIDPDELPHNFKPGPKGLPKVPVLEPAGESDGSAPLPIKKGQRVVIEVSASAPVEEGDTETFTGTLLIQSNTLDTIQLSMTRGQTIATFDIPSLTIPQGQEGDLPITVRRVAGPEKNIRFSLHFGPESNGVSMRDATIHLNRGETKPASLHLSVAPDAKLGSRDLLIQGDVDTPPRLPLNIVPGILSVTLLQQGEISVQQGRALELRVRIALQNPKDSTAVTFTAGNFLPGVTMSPQTVEMIGDFQIGGFMPNLDSDASRTVSLRLDIGAHSSTNPAPAPAFPLTINYSAFDGQQTGTLTIPMSINLTEINFFSGQFQAGQVQCRNARVYCRSDGLWGFAGSLHDFSDIFGDNYAIGFAFNFTKDGGGVGKILTGELGASLTSPSETAIFRVGGKEPFIEQNWPDIFSQGVTFRLRADGNFGQLVSDLGDDLKKLGRDISRTFSEPKEQDPPPDGIPLDSGDVGGGDEGGGG